MILVIINCIYHIYSPSKSYFIKEFPFFIPIAFLILLILPLFDKDGYPILMSEGRLIYYTFLSIPPMLLFSDLLVWVILKLRRN